MTNISQRQTDRQTDVRLHYEQYRPEVKTIEEDGEAKEHWRPQTDRQTDVRLHYEEHRPEVKTVEEDGKTKQHWRPQTDKQTDRQTDVRLQYEQHRPEVKTVQEDGETKEHWRPQAGDEHSRPGEVHRYLLTEVVANLPERLEAAGLGPGTIQLGTRVHANGRRCGPRPVYLIVLIIPRPGHLHPRPVYLIVLIIPRPDHLHDLLLPGIIVSRVIVHWKRAVAVAFVKHVQQT